MSIPLSNARGPVLAPNGATNGWYQILPLAGDTKTAIRLYIQKSKDGSIAEIPPNPPGFTDLDINLNAMYEVWVGGYDENPGPWNIQPGAVFLATGTKTLKGVNTSTLTGVYVVVAPAAAHEGNIGLDYFAYLCVRMNAIPNSPSLDVVIGNKAGNDLNAVVLQTTPASTIVTANPFIAYGKIPSVQVVNLADNKIVTGVNVVFSNNNSLITITLSQALAVRVLLN